MNDFNQHVFRLGHAWIGRYGDDNVVSDSIFVVVGWVNRHRILNNQIPLDLWIAQQLHWAHDPKMIVRSKGVAA